MFCTSIPIEDPSADVMKVVEDYSAWLAAPGVPNFFIDAQPGSILVHQRNVCRPWPNQQDVTTLTSPEPSLQVSHRPWPARQFVSR